MNSQNRKLGINLIEEIPWGKHLCQFYQTREDLIAILVPYFKAGLENNEYCMWVTSDPLTVEDAKEALKKEVENLNDYIKKGQIEILDYSEWYTKSGKLESEKVLQGVVEKENQALKRGFDGLRLSGNTFWLESNDWNDFIEYEATVDSVIGEHRIIAICSYSLDKCGASEILDVVSCHQYALIRKKGKWEVFQNAGLKRAEKNLCYSYEELKIRNRILEIFLTCPDEEMYENLLQFVLETFESTYGTFGYFNQNGAFVVPSLTRKIYWEKCQIPEKEIIFKRGTFSGIWDRAIKEKKILYSNNGPFHTPEGHIPIKNTMVTPIIYHNEVISAIHIANKSKDYTEKDKALLEIIAKHIAPVLYARLQKEKEQKELRQAQEALRESENTATALINGITDIVALLDTGGIILDINTATAHRFHRKVEELIGTCGWDLIPQELAKHRKAFFDQVIQSGMRVRFEDERDGLWFDNVFFPILDAEGKVEKITVLARDITSKKEKEGQLRIKDSAIASAINAVAFADLEGNITYVNSSFLKMWGFDDEKEALGKSVVNFWNEEGKVLDVVKKLQGSGSCTLELVAVKKDGVTFNVQLSAHMVTDEGGNPICMMSSFVDITERKRLEKELDRYCLHLEDQVKERTGDLVAANEQLQQKITELKYAHEALSKSENQYRSFIHSFPGIAFQGDLKFIPIFFHGSVEEITGYTEQEFVSGKPRWDQIIHPDDLPINCGKTREKILATPHYSEEREYRIIRKDGQIRWIHENIQNICDDAGKPLFVQGVIYDISKRKKAEEDLIKSEEKYRALMNNASDAILVADSNGNLIDANKKAEELFGYTREELLTMNVAQIHPKEHLKDVMASFKEIVQKGFGSYNDGLIQKKDDKIVPIDLTGSAIEYGGKKVFQAIFRDITERKKMEEELQKMEKLKAVGVLAGGIAHDFNNLLTGIIGNISLAEIYVKPEDSIFDALQRAKKASQQAAQLTNQLLTFSKGGAPIKAASSITELIKETATFALRGSKVRGESFLPDTIWPVEIDKGQINQTINNLIINANHAMPDGGTIRISAENVIIGINDDLPLKQGKYVKISVKDEGIGIQEKYLSKIFDPYFTTKDEGSGLGLATCFSIINKHRGHIDVKSEVGVGSTFHIYLPASEKKIFEVKEVIENTSYLGQGKILFMDDEQNVIDAAKQMLAQLGYEVEITKNGTEAIEIYKKAKEVKETFDTVILDLTIPGDMGGKETIKKLLEIDPEIKAIVSSGYSNDPIMSGYEHFGFKGVVAKPYDIKELSKVLYTVINGKKDPPVKT